MNKFGVSYWFGIYYLSLGIIKLYRLFELKNRNHLIQDTCSASEILRMILIFLVTGTFIFLFMRFRTFTNFSCMSKYGYNRYFPFINNLNSSTFENSYQITLSPFKIPSFPKVFQAAGLQFSTGHFTIPGFLY